MITEYKTKDELLANHTNIVQLTRKIGLISVNMSFEYDGKSNPEVRSRLREKLLTSYPELKRSKAGIHIAWSKTRFCELFSIKNRIKRKYYTKCAFTVGNPYREGEQTKIPFIEWRPEFYDVSVCTDPDVTYIYQTTKNTWRIYKSE